jgi:UDP-N-acetylmuramoyl-tripeptide--D-alanyl-D-alanine ligase
MQTLADVVEGVGGGRIAELAARAVREFVIDSRRVMRGDVFIALPGERVDGHDYVGHALGRGAAVVLVHQDIDRSSFPETVWIDATVTPTLIPSPLPLQGEGGVIIKVDNTMAALQRLAAFWRARFAPKLKVIGITGSIGKTTTKEVIAQVLGTRFSVLKNEGNLNNEIGVPLTLLKLRPEHEYAIIEMGMYARGEIALFASLAKPQIGVITMVAPVHLERLGTIENIALAKAELVEALPEGGVAILNDDDERVRAMAAVSKGRVVTYGLTPRADVWADDIESNGLDGITFTLHYRPFDQPRLDQKPDFPEQAGFWSSSLMRVPLLGRHSVHTALRAAAVSLVEGLTCEDIQEGFLVPAPQLRLAVAEGPHRSMVLDDTYNASEESTIAALNLLEEINGGVHIAVLGDMLELGDLEVQAHRNVGCRAALVAQHVVCVGERARWIAEEAIACGAALAHVYPVADNAAALAVLREIVTEKSIILVKGSRGMKMEEIVNGLAELTGSERKED